MNDLKKQLTEAGAVALAIAFVYEDRIEPFDCDRLFDFDPSSLDRLRAQDAMFSAVRARAQVTRALAVIVGYDSYVYEKPPGVSELAFNEACATPESRDEGIGTGLISKTEAIMVLVQMPLQTWSLSQPYERDGARIVFGTPKENFIDVEGCGQMFPPHWA